MFDITGVGLSIIATISWFIAGNPYGVDSSYFALGVPVAAMTISHFLTVLNRGGQSATPVMATPATERYEATWRLEISGRTL